jgi:hypothetical protein
MGWGQCGRSPEEIRDQIETYLIGWGHTCSFPNTNCFISIYLKFYLSKNYFIPMLIDTSEKGLRGSIPQDFPYFHVEFGPSRGLFMLLMTRKTSKASLVWMWFWWSRGNTSHKNWLFLFDEFWVCINSIKTIFFLNKKYFNT